MKKTITNTRLRLYSLVVATLLPALTAWSGTGYFFYVQFANKRNSPYSLSAPQAYLSQRAIDRRQAMGIAIDSTDLPVNPNYTAQIDSLGINIHCKTKWLNGVTVLLDDTSKIQQIRTLPFVTKVQYTGLRTTAQAAPQKIKNESEDFNYGTTTTQIYQVNGAFLHNAGYTGKGIIIGILDGGFNSVNTNPAFDSLRLQNRLLGTKDFAEPLADIYTLHQHGANVLSIMTANLPGQYLGVAPQASFWLIRTEYVPTEYLVETDFWTSGIEFADSVGVDVINSSLGYTEFDDKSMNFTYADMNGKVSRASIAAGMAARKGIIVCNSNGNDGSKTWKYLGSPADAEGVLAIGAVTAAGVPSAFTSFGPSADGRVKPEICAQGTATALVNAAGVPVTGNGTSFSSPVIAGLTACLLQGYKETHAPHDVQTVRNALIRSGNLYSNPESDYVPQLGYGIPNFEYAFKYPIFSNIVKTPQTLNCEISYDSLNKTIHVIVFDPLEINGKTIRVYSATGRTVMKKRIDEVVTTLSASKLSAGIYLVSISGNNKIETKKIVIE